MKLSLIGQFVRRHWGLVILWAVTIWFGWMYGPKNGQWLLGWDNLVPEMDFSLNVKRLLTSIWQGYRGLGGVDGMAQGADLLRTLFLWGANAVVADNWLRFLWMVVMLGAAMSGAYMLSRTVVGERFVSMAGLVAGLFYGFNLGVVQLHYAPFEPFWAFFGFLPWLLLSFWQVMEASSWRRWWRFGLVSFMSAPAFMVQTLFLVYGFVLGVMGFVIVIHQDWQVRFKRMLAALLLTVAVHAYWLGPVVYFALGQPEVVGQARVNTLSTPETVAMNAARSGLDEVLSLRGYVLDYTDWNGERVDYLMTEWVSHLQKPWVLEIWWGLVAMGVVGMALLGLWRRQWWVVVVFGLLVWLLSRGMGEMGMVYEWLEQTIPYFGQLFRSAFTKLIVPLTLMVAVGLGALISYIGNTWRAVMVGMVLVGLMYGGFPAWQGNYIGERMYVSLPSEYQSLYTFMSVQPAARVLTLPMHQIWGWQYHEWGYRGSGFVWHGVKQPILDRAFDVWNPYNERAYEDISLALYREDEGQFLRLLRQYGIAYLLLDEGVVTGGDSQQVLRMDETRAWLDGMSDMEVVFEQGNLTVWRYGGGLSAYGEGVVQAVVEGRSEWHGRSRVKFESDQLVWSVAAEESGRVKIASASTMPASVWLESVDEASVGLRIEVDVPAVRVNEVLVKEEKVLTYRITVPAAETADYVFVGGRELALSAVTNEELLGWVLIDFSKEIPVLLGAVERVEGEEVFTRRVGEVTLDLAQIDENEVDFEVESGDEVRLVWSSGVSGFSRLPNREAAFNCDVLGRGSASRDRQAGGFLYQAKDFGVSCDYVDYFDRVGFDDYMLIGSVSSTEGRGVRWYVHNQANGRVDGEEIAKEQFGVWVPTSSRDSHMVVSFDVKSFDEMEGLSVIKGYDLRPFPSAWLDYWSFEPAAVEGNLFGISESFEPGWVGMYMPEDGFKIFDFRILDHVKLNGWANGWLAPESEVGSWESGGESQKPETVNMKTGSWTLLRSDELWTGEASQDDARDGDGIEDDEGRVVVLFWPQYMQWLGMVVAVMTLGWLGRKAWLEQVGA